MKSFLPRSLVFIVAHIIFIGASIVGMIIGRKLCAHVPARALQIGFASICLVIAAYMLFRAGV